MCCLLSGNGTIEYDEFEKVIGKQLVIANYKTKQLREAFGKLDKDGDGFITAVEIRTGYIIMRTCSCSVDPLTPHFIL